MFTECSHSVKSSQIFPSGDAALGKKWHTRQNSQNQNQFGYVRCFTECYTYTYAATWGWLKYCNPNYTLFSHSSFTNNFNKLTTKIKLFLIKAKRHKVWIKENNNIYGHCFVRNFSMRDYFIFLSWLRCDIVKLKHKYNI